MGDLADRGGSLVKTRFAGGSTSIYASPDPNAKKPKRKVYVSSRISHAQQRVLNHIKKNSPLARTKIRDDLNTCWSTVNRAIDKLLDEDMIEAVYVGKIQKYQAKNGQPAGQGPSA